MLSHDFSNLLVPLKHWKSWVLWCLDIWSLFTQSFTILFLHFLLVLISIDNIYQAIKTMLDHISKHLKVYKKFSALRHFIISIHGVWQCGPIQSFEIWHILCHHSHNGVLNNEMAIKLAFQTDPVGVELFSYVNTPFCCNNFAWLLDTRVKTSMIICTSKSSFKNRWVTRGHNRQKRDVLWLKVFKNTSFRLPVCNL